MINILLEGNRKMAELFEKIDSALQENFEVINSMLVPKSKDVDKED